MSKLKKRKMPKRILTDAELEKAEELLAFLVDLANRLKSYKK
jgi:hypothetical protein